MVTDVTEPFQTDFTAESHTPNLEILSIIKLLKGSLPTKNKIKHIGWFWTEK